MKQLLTTLALLIATSMVGQSKKEWKEAFYQIHRDYKELEKSNQRTISKLEKHNNFLKESIDKTNKELIKILPNLIVSEGFPEKFYPTDRNINLYDEIYSLKQEDRDSDTSISSEYDVKNYSMSYEDEQPDTVLLLGVIDTTLWMNYANVIYGTVPVLYKGKIRYTTFFDLKGSLGHKNAKEAYKKKAFIDEWGEELGEKIYRGIPWIGMTFWELRAMFGGFYSSRTYESLDGTIDIHTVKKNYRTYVFTVSDGKVTDISY